MLSKCVFPSAFTTRSLQMRYPSIVLSYAFMIFHLHSMFESLRLSRGLVCVLKTFSAVRDYLLPAGDMIEVGAGGRRGLRTKHREVNFLHFSQVDGDTLEFVDYWDLIV